MKFYLKLLALLRPLWEVFYSVAFYQKVARHWPGMALRYLLLLAVVMSLPSYFLLFNAITQFYASTVEPLAAQFPNVVIDQGQVQIDKPLPYIIYLPEQHRPYILFLDEDRLSEEQVRVLPADIVVTKRVIYTHHLPQQPVTIYSLAEDTHRELSTRQVASVLLIFKRILLYMSFPLVVGVIFVVAVVFVLLLAMLAQLVALIIKVKLTYRQRVRLAVVALTPSVVIGILLYWLNLTHDSMPSVLVLLLFGYYGFALYCNKTVR